MAENREHDVALTRFVGQFRRFARLAAVDPLRLLPPDPTIQVMSLGAAVDALIDVTPFDPLRRAIAAAARDARADAVRARVQPLSHRASKVRPHAAPVSSGRAARAGTARAVGTPAAGPSAPLPQVADARSRGERTRTDTSSTPTLAERRGALRRNLRLAGTATPSSPTASLRPAATTTPDDSARRLSGSGAPRASAPVADATAANASRPVRPLPAGPRLLPPAAARAVGSTARTSASEEALAQDASRRSAEDASGLIDAAAAAVEAPEVAAADAAGGAEVGVDVVRREQRRAAASRRAFSPLAASSAASPDGVILPPLLTRRGESPAHTDGIRRSRSAERDTRLGFADDLFEALYREGVDLSWP